MVPFWLSTKITIYSTSIRSNSEVLLGGRPLKRTFKETFVGQLFLCYQLYNPFRILRCCHGEKSVFLTLTDFDVTTSHSFMLFCRSNWPYHAPHSNPTRQLKLSAGWNQWRFSVCRSDKACPTGVMATDRERLEQLKKIHGFREPDRGNLDDNSIEWRTGKPDYAKANLAFVLGKTQNHETGTFSGLV